VGGALASKERKAERAVTETKEKVHELQKMLETGEREAQVLTQRLTQARQQEQARQQALEMASTQRERVRQAMQGLSLSYHPYDLETGAERNPEQVSISLAQHFAQLEAVASEAQLSENALKKIAKAKKVMAAMVTTIAFFWLTLRAKVQALALTPEVEQAIYQHLIPGIYLQLVAQKVDDPPQRLRLQHLSAELLAPLQVNDGLLKDLTTEEVTILEKVALECAHLFQRSSSCVEGRNGQLALHHHQLHRISSRKLAALTTVHNYFVKREDGTTAAQRFFGTKPRDLFAWVLDRVDLPGRPAQKRTQPQRARYLVIGAT
jgi:prefoldin subunit 5